MTDNLRPSPAEVEALAEEMVILKSTIANKLQSAADEVAPLNKRMEELKATATDWISKFGSAHAEKSKILHGVAYEIMGTFGMTTSTDAAAVETFRLALAKAKLAKLLKRLFSKTIRYDLAPDASEVLRGAKLKPRLAGLWAKCVLLVPKTPTITPRLKKKDADKVGEEPRSAA